MVRLVIASLTFLGQRFLNFAGVQTPSPTPHGLPDITPWLLGQTTEIIITVINSPIRN